MSGPPMSAASIQGGYQPGIALGQDFFSLCDRSHELHAERGLHACHARHEKAFCLYKNMQKSSEVELDMAFRPYSAECRRNFIELLREGGGCGAPQGPPLAMQGQFMPNVSRPQMTSDLAEL